MLTSALLTESTTVSNAFAHVGVHALPTSVAAHVTPWGFVKAGHCAGSHVADRTGFDVAWPSDYAGYANAAVVEELLVANVRTAVVTDEEDDGVFGEVFVFKALEYLADFLIKDLDAF